MQRTGIEPAISAPAVWQGYQWQAYFTAGAQWRLWALKKGILHKQSESFFHFGVYIIVFVVQSSISVPNAQQAFQERPYPLRLSHICPSRFRSPSAETQASLRLSQHGLCTLWSIFVAAPLLPQRNREQSTCFGTRPCKTSWAAWPAGPGERGPASRSSCGRARRSCSESLHQTPSPPLLPSQPRTQRCTFANRNGIETTWVSIKNRVECEHLLLGAASALPVNLCEVPDLLVCGVEGSEANLLDHVGVMLVRQHGDVTDDLVDQVGLRERREREGNNNGAGVSKGRALAASSKGKR